MLQMQREKKMYKIIYDSEIPQDFGYTYPFLRLQLFYLFIYNEN